MTERKRRNCEKKMPQNRSINTPAHEGKKTNKNNLFFSKATEIWYKQTNTHTITHFYFIYRNNTIGNKR